MAISIGTFRTPSKLMDLVRRAGRLMGIGGNPGPQHILEGVYTSSVGTPPLINTRSLLEGFDTMPWLRACSEKIGVALAMTDWRLYAVGAPPAAPKAPADLSDLVAGRDYVVDAQDLAAAAAAAMGTMLEQRVRQIRGQLEPWARRDHILQRQLGNTRWKNLEFLRRRGQLQEIADHPFYNALEIPNPFMGRMGLMKITEASLDLVGDAFWLKERNRAGTPVGYWPIPAHWIVETPTPARPFHRVNWRSFVRDLPESEVLWFHEPAPVHPYERGSGIGFALGDEIEIDEYLAKMTKQMFFNDADPKWIMSLGEGSSESEGRRLERDILQRNQGFWRKFKPYFLVNGPEDINKRIHEFQRPTMEQLVYPGLRKAQRDVVIQTFGAPPELFGITENSNRATIEGAEYLFAKWVLLPRGERLRSILQIELITEYDPRIVLDFPSPVDEDKEFELNVRKAASWAWDADEWRALAGDAPMEGGRGKVHLVPLNSYTTTTLDDGDAGSRPDPAPPAATPTPEAQGEGVKTLVGVIATMTEGQTRMAETCARALEVPVRELHVKVGTLPPPEVHTDVHNTVNVPVPSVEVHPPEVKVRAPVVHVAAPEISIKNEVKTPAVQDIRILEAPELKVAITDVPETVTETEVTDREARGIKKTQARTRKAAKG